MVFFTVRVAQLPATSSCLLTEGVIQGSLWALRLSLGLTLFSFHKMADKICKPEGSDPPTYPQALQFGCLGMKYSGPL